MSGKSGPFQKCKGNFREFLPTYKEFAKAFQGGHQYWCGIRGTCSIFVCLFVCLFVALFIGELKQLHSDSRTRASSIPSYQTESALIVREMSGKSIPLAWQTP